MVRLPLREILDSELPTERDLFLFNTRSSFIQYSRDVPGRASIINPCRRPRESAVDKPNSPSDIPVTDIGK